MGRVLAFWESTVGKKAVMAVTGLIMAAYLVAHVAGNLLVFGGAEAIDGYARFLHEHPVVVWIARVVLLAAIFLHMVAVYQLFLRDRAARPIGYSSMVPQASTWSSRTMRWGGVIIAFFVVFHVLHFTTGTIRPAGFTAGRIFDNLTGSFRVGWVVALYLVAMAAVGLHLLHGTWASLRTLGMARPSPDPQQRPVATVLAVAIWLGFTAIPVVIALGGLR